VFDVAPGGWEALDVKEGAPSCYRQQAATALSLDGETIPVTTYVVRSERRARGGFVAPTPEYVDVDRAGLAERGLSQGGLKAAAIGEPVPWEVDGLFEYGALLPCESRLSRLEPLGLECT
jgi:hypothetical protein